MISPVPDLELEKLVALFGDVLILTTEPVLEADTPRLLLLELIALAKPVAITLAVALDEAE